MWAVLNCHSAPLLMAGAATFSGEWSEMHVRKSRKGDITAMKRSKSVGDYAVKLALFQDSFHEGVEPGQRLGVPDVLVLFEPGLCHRDRA